MSINRFIVALNVDVLLLLLEIENGPKFTCK